MIEINNNNNLKQLIMKKITVILMLMMLMSICVFSTPNGKHKPTTDRRVMVDNPNLRKVTKRNNDTDRRIIRVKPKTIKNHKAIKNHKTKRQF